MAEVLSPEQVTQLRIEVARKLLLAGLDVTAGGAIPILALIVGGPIMGATGLFLAAPPIRKGAEDLHDALEAIKKLRNQ